MNEIIEAANILWNIHYVNKTCQICLTKKTCLWRKNKVFECLCNRCALRIAKAVKYYKKV